MSERETEYKRYERERMISLADLVEEILRRIWLVVILAVVCAVACAGYKYVQDRHAANAAVSEAAQAKTLNALSDEEMARVRSVADIYRRMAVGADYMDTSIRMQIDPFHEDCVVMQYLVQAEEDVTSDVVQAVEGYITQGSLAADLQELYPVEDGGSLAELVTFVQGSTAAASSSTETLQIPMDSSVFNIRVIHTDADAAADLADGVEQCLDAYMSSLTAYFGHCELALFDRSAARVYDSALQTEQTALVTSQYTAANQINNLTTNLSDKEADALDVLLAEEDETDAAAGETAVTTSAVSVHISRRYTLIGVAIGIVLGIILIILYYLFRGTINVAQEMPDEFGVPVLGQVHLRRPRNLLVRGWRRLVNRKKALPPETEQEIALTNLRNFCRSHQVERILLTGSRTDISENTWLNAVRESLRADRIEVGIVGGLSDSPQALEELDTYTYIALVETLRTSIYKDVVREIDICLEREVQVAGAILLD